VGAPWNPLVLGKHSGRHAVQKRCADLGFQLEGDELVRVYRALMSIADDRKTLTDDDIRSVVGVAAGADVVTVVQTVDPFDTPSSPPQPVMHESGYGHGV
jgi:isopropylmalate/homocitrate/citramalate synthase